MANPLGSFIWYELMTTDPDAAAKFYGAVVGWKITGPANSEGADPAAKGGVDYRHIVRTDGGGNGGVLALTQEMCDGGARPVWLGYLYVADVDAAVQAIVADGGKSLMPAFDIDVGRIAMVMDPQGLPFYVMKPIPPVDNPHGESDVYDRWGEQHVSWNELYTPDLEAAQAFYAKHFNFEFNEKMSMGPMGDYCFIDHGGQTIGAMMQKPPQVPMPLWNFYIRVADLDAAIAAVKAGGGQVINGPMEVPGGDRIINGIDPQGAPFSLVAKGR
jgi:predicted enzyme related to lactoylglutathione lyase